MKKFLLISLLIMINTAYSQNKADHIACNDLSVRYTVFSLLAKTSKDEESYKYPLYKEILKSNVGTETREILLKLIDLAWKSKNDDTVAFANYLYTMCTKDEGI